MGKFAEKRAAKREMRQQNKLDKIAAKQEGKTARALSRNEAISNVTDKLGDFASGIFGGGRRSGGADEVDAPKTGFFEWLKNLFS